MNCHDIQQYFDDLDADQLKSGFTEEIQAHLADCTDCRSFYNDIRLLRKAMKSAELPQLPQSARQRLYLQNDEPVYIFRWVAAAALLLLLFGLGFFAALNVRQGTQDHPRPSRTAQTVVMAIDSVSDRQGVTLRLLLPPGVEVDGHPGTEVIEWRDDLSAGVNRLRIPLILSRGESGMLIAQVEYQGKIQELKVQLGHLTGEPQTKTGEKTPRRLT